MGRGNQDKRSFQRALQANGNKGWASANELTNIKRARPTRNQAPSTLPNVDVHGILFALVIIVFVVYPLAQWALGL
jgi:hypothetical protein